MPPRTLGQSYVALHPFLVADQTTAIGKMQLNEKIYHDLGGQIDSGTIPCELTLSALSKHYGVSAAPVRVAVSRLVGDGRLHRHENGRLRVACNSSKQSTKPLEQPATPVGLGVEQRMRLAVIRMSLRGENGFLREEATAEKYGIGRTALRPILARLAGTGLLEQAPRRGWRIHPFDPSDLIAFLEVRELLERRALTLSRQRLQPRLLAEYLQRNQQALSGQEPLDNRLHDHWIEQSQNRYLQRFFSREAVYYACVFDFATPESHQVVEMAAQHCGILESLIDQRWNEAAKSLGHHIRTQRPIVLSLVDKLKATQ